MLRYLSVLFLFSLSVTAQNIRFEGIVQDTLGIPLDMANVMAVNDDTKAMDAYSITAGNGRFQMTLKANSSYTIKVSYIGFQPLNYPLKTERENLQRTLVLKEGGISLEGVEVVQEMPVSIKGDTIVYNADSFKTGGEQKLEDILKKLPGVEVTEDGEIEVEGRRVTQLLVEGKKFFEGDTKLGAKNIPSDAVDKVQVLRNFNEVSQLRGLENNEENIALNIKLKKGKDKFWFGDITVGGGPDERFLLNPKIFYYSPKTSVNVLSNFNNYGDVPFTNRDFFRLTGSARNTIGRSGTNVGISANSLGLSTNQNDRAVEIDNKFGALNITQEFSKKFNVSGFGILSSNKTLTNVASNSGIFRPNSTEVQTQEQRTDISDFRNNLAIFKIGSKFKPNSNFQLDYDAFVRRSNQSEDNAITTLSQVFTNGTTDERFNDIFSFKRQDPIAFNQSLNMFWTQNKKSTWVLEMQHQYQDEDPFYNPSLLEKPFEGIGFQDVAGRYDIRQERFVKTNKLDAKLDYYYSLTPKGSLNLTLGNTNAYQSFNSSIFQILDNGEVFQVPNQDEFNFDNDVRYNFNDAYVGVHYKFVVGKFTINPGFNLHRFNMYNDQLNSRVRDDFTRFLPDMFVRWEIKKSETMIYTYRMRNSFNDINSLVDGYLFNNFNTLNAGNRFIENALDQSHVLRYSKYNLFNFSNIFANLSYNRTTDPVVSRAFFNGIYQISERVNADFSNESVNGSFTYQRTFAKFYRLGGTVSLSWNKNNQLFVNPMDPLNPDSDFIRTIESINQIYRFTFSTQFREWPNLETGYNVIINENPNNTFTTHSPFARIEYVFGKGFTLNGSYTYSNFRSSTGDVNNTFDILSASLNYRKNREAKMEYRISGTNLLNTQFVNRDSFNIIGFSSTQEQILPRYLIASLKYNL